jgi:hypothetical protein
MKTLGAGTVAGAVAGLLACALATGCGSTPAGTVREIAVAATPPLATAATGTSGAGWAVVEMGGATGQEDNFWELFVRPAGSTTWRLATPPGVADNGGIEVTGTAGSLTAGFRPSQDLTFSPLAATSDDGASWSQAGPVSPGLAEAPDALASGPGGRLIALTSGGTAELGPSTGARWTRLASVRAVTRAAAGQACGLTGFTAAAFGPAGVPMLAGGCSRPGTAGIFTEHGGSWQAAGPAVPGSLAGQDVDVLGMSATGTGVVALLQAGSGPKASLFSAWSRAGGWVVSAPLAAGAGGPRSESFGPGAAMAVLLPGSRGETLAGPGSSWRVLPRLPAATAALALGTGGRVDALTVHAGTFADWRLGPTGDWGLAQSVPVSIPYGSSS